MLERFWIYQQERFPLFTQGLLIAIISLGGVNFSLLARLALQSMPLMAIPQWGAAWLVAFVSALGFFFQLRVADEFKDYADDLRYRPYRAVPRGLVTLRELAMLAGVVMLLQAGLALWFSIRLFWLLCLIWAYIGVMRQEFFVAAWLRRHSVLYLVSHMVITPLIFLYITACDWWVVGARPPLGLAWFLASGFFNGVSFEMARKIRAPQDEEPGVETYSQLWGRRVAVIVWVLASLFAGACGTLAVRSSPFFVPLCSLAVLLTVGAVVIGGRFLRKPCTSYAQALQLFSGVGMLLLYLSIGVGPLVMTLVGR